MAPLARQIFSGFTNPSIIDTTATFNQCDYLLLNVTGIGGDALEIAAAIQIQSIAQVDFLNGATAANEDLGIKEILLDVPFFDTSTIIPIPSEATAPGAECKVCLSTSFSVVLEIFAVYHDPCTCTDLLEEIKNAIDIGNALSGAIAANQVAQDVVLLGTATILGVALAPATGGASLSLPGTASAVFPAATGLLLPALGGLGLALPFGI